MSRTPHVDLSTESIAGSPGGVMFGPGTYLFSGSGAPVDGASGTGVGWAGRGSLYVNRANGTLFQNTGTVASPTWTSR